MRLFHANSHSSEISAIDWQRLTALYHSISDGNWVRKKKRIPRLRVGTKCNWVFVALLTPKSTRPASVCPCVCPAQTLFLQIEPRVPPFTLYPSLLFVHFCTLHLLASFSVSLFSPPPLSLPLSLCSSPSLFSISESTPLCAHMRQVPGR